MKEKILVVASHPDDELLGVGGTIARFVSEGNEAHCLILGEGAVSRKKSEDEKDILELESLHKNAIAACTVLGYSKVDFVDFPDNRFDSIDLLDIVKVVERYIKDFCPTIVFTHFGNDLNIDHQKTFQAVLTATRPIGNYSVNKLYAFDTLSSTEWNFSSKVFSPNYFVDISDFIDIKQKAMECYKTELCDFPHPRSIKGLESQAQKYGSMVFMQYAEAFMLIRECHKKLMGGGIIKV